MDLFSRYADAVITDPQDQHAIIFLERYMDSGRLGVAADIDQILLDEAEKDRGLVLPHWDILFLEIHRDRHAAELFKVFGLPLKGGHQAEIIQDARAQVRAYFLHDTDHPFRHFDHVV